ncbi:Ribose-phosphate diphosphokinase [Thiomonas delicata]|uniref:Ribose-phosphate diphosphokinase n=1 Tax=Thiomonas delicata TaxID=364030 RepID=A0A238D7Q5_THIDL|nr:Ribose-phosphate diphosphokinase [Thiomonas delicata]
MRWISCIAIQASSTWNHDVSRIAFYPMPGNEARAKGIAQALSTRADVGLGACAVHHFPDGESLAQIQPPEPGAQAVLVCTLNQPDAKTVPLLMAAATLRDLGAASVGLVAPYLAYMRQDKRFLPGQAISARVYARWLSAHFDWLLTVDPHLHRIRALPQIYTLRSRVLRAAPRMAAWIAANVANPLIVGPDGESAQWAADVAGRAGAPMVVLEKTRLGDKDVRVTVPDLRRHAGRTPVLIDDIISSGRTLVAALERLREAATPPPVCVAVHGLFAGDALAAIREAGAARVACTDTVDHPVEAIDLTSDLAQGVLDMILPVAGHGAPPFPSIGQGAEP